MSSKIFSAAVVGLEARLIEVEADTSCGLHVFNIVGLPDTAVKESRDRVGAALKNSGADPPHHLGRVTVNLAPADLKKAGPAYDLPMALGIMLASRQISFDPQGKIFLGELALDGALRPIRGVLSIALMAQKKKFQTIFLPQDNAGEASLVKGLEVIPARTLSELLFHLVGKNLIKPFPPLDFGQFFRVCQVQEDLAYIKGQEHVKRALEIAAAGAHNILMFGPPGAGKTMLARTLPSILPQMTLAEAIEVTRIYSVVGYLPKDKPLITVRPFRNPHHTASGVALVGGGTWPRPGEISLAHRGVLFLDEFGEFSRPVLENLRQPLEDGCINISRAQSTLSFPSRFILVAAWNPCPCGYFGDPEKRCKCAAGEISKYQKKISGPLLDRIDLHVEVPRVDYRKLSSQTPTVNSRIIRERVERSRLLQSARFKNLKILTNSEMSSQLVKKFCGLDQQGQDLLNRATSQFFLSARSYFRVLKIARTIADLAGSRDIQTSHLAEALQYRPKMES